MRSSTPSSRSASPEPVETMQIFVKNVSGDSEFSATPSATSHTNESSVIPMTVSSSLTIENLLTLLSVRTSLPSDTLRLVHAGKHLSTTSSTLADYSIQKESTLHLALPLRGGMPPKKIKCSHKDCKDAAQRIVGDCGFCQGHFCGKHRLLEDHKCTGLEDVSFSSPENPDNGMGTQWWLCGLSEVVADILAT